jgi:hypothetical protein
MTQPNCNGRIQIRLWNKRNRASIVALDQELQAYERTLEGVYNKKVKKGLDPEAPH